MSIDENLMNDFRIFLEALPTDLGRGSLNGMRVQLLYKVRANLQAAKPEQAQTAVVLPEPDFDALARIRDEAIGELLKKLFNAAVKYAGTSGAGYSPASADAYHAAEEIKTQITSTVTAYSPTQAEIESYATATAEISKLRDLLNKTGSALTGEIAKRDAEIARWKRAFEKESKLANKAETDLFAANFEIAGLRTELAHAGLQLTALRAQLAEAQKDVVALWMMLDDIDTGGDIAKADDVLYRAIAERSHKRRFEPRYEWIMRRIDAIAQEGDTK